MHVATIRLALSLLLFRFTACQQPKARIGSIDQSELVRKDRDIRQHRQVRQTLFILTEVGNLIFNIFVDIVI